MDLKDCFKGYSKTAICFMLHLWACVILFIDIGFYEGDLWGEREWEGGRERDE